MPIDVQKVVDNFEVQTGAGVKVFGGTVGVGSGYDLNITNTALATGDKVQIANGACTYTAPT